MRRLILLSISTLFVAVVAGSNKSRNISHELQQQQRRRHFTHHREWMMTAWRGGDRFRRSSRGVSVSPDAKLPGGIAGASLVAFRAPVPVPTNEYDVDDDDIGTKDTGEAQVEPPLSDDASPDNDTSSAVSKKWASVKERTLPAILMLGGVGLLSYYMKEDGLILLTLGMQIGMYQEMTKVIGGEFPYQFYKWYWFTTASIAVNAPRMFPWATNSISAITYGMSILGILFSIISFNWKKAQVEDFREYLRQAAVSFLVLLLVVVPSSFWISTLEEFGMKWVILPAALVIINDTMAYFFGITMGKHSLLPSISPKKTWEGFVGAALATIAVSIDLFPTKQDALILSVFVSLVGPFGGFLASVIKRAYNQKDFGALFPGHGGLVDRLDCQLILAPFVYLYLSLTRDVDSSAADLFSKMAGSTSSA